MMLAPVAGSQNENYRLRVAAEKDRYEDCADVHDLPDIFHYWSNKYIRPKLEPFGFNAPNDLFAKYLREQHGRRPLDKPMRFASIGAGNCDLEISLAAGLISQGRSDFVIDCLELNPTMLERGFAAAASAGVSRQIRLVEADINQWAPEHEYDAILANQSLHHVLNLEGLFKQVGLCLRSDGSFIISDIIGRNGHLRWPEALDIVHEFWRKLPPSYRFNNRLQRYEELYENWDCSQHGFEGIRSQDILPLLVANFHFRLFVGFGNVIDPFIDRVFGANFDINAAWDRAFIGQVHRRDEQALLAGEIKPTHMLAVVGKQGDASAYVGPLAPALCIRPADRAEPRNKKPDPWPGSYEWHSWPHSPQDELEIGCRRLREADSRIRGLMLDAELLDKDLVARTFWAQRLDRELAERNAGVERLDRELTERTAWARRLDRELAERTAWAQQLQEEVVEVTAWAHGLEQELAERTAWALQLRHELRCERELTWLQRISRFTRRLLPRLGGRFSRKRES